MIIANLSQELAEFGLMTRGAFHPSPDDGAPEGVRTMVLVGNAGPAMWQVFAATRPDHTDPLDTWSKGHIDRLARGFGARAFYPFEGPPYHPFQKWAMKADDVSSSPIGPLIHPEFGMWHAYRAAIAFDGVLAIPALERTARPCDTCTDKPCLTSCPVDAFSEQGYDVPACRDHLSTPEGGDCMNLGCKARRACPVGRKYIYHPDQALFHMEKFLNPD